MSQSCCSQPSVDPGFDVRRRSRSWSSNSSSSPAVNPGSKPPASFSRSKSQNSGDRRIERIEREVGEVVQRLYSPAEANSGSEPAADVGKSSRNGNEKECCKTWIHRSIVPSS